MASNRLVWFALVDGRGQAYKGTTVDIVTDKCQIVDFRNAVHLKKSSILPSVVPAQLIVYANEAAYDRKDGPLEVVSTIGKLGSPEEAIQRYQQCRVETHPCTVL
ncbi:hypothetical protein AC1031_004791 [Aphanomyces cochlioides]|nr:hypothetical protein AC1031_004791 [Aphanomyces cochlioides]